MFKTKLSAPKRRSNLVARPRLLNHLAEGSARKLTLICAPAGYGKTTLITEWIAVLQTADAGESPIICWLSLDAGDNDPALFLSYLVHAFENANTLPNTEASSILKSFPPPPFQTVLSVLINILDDLARPIYLVLDDYQFITNHAIHDGLAHFLERIPANAHLVIATRSDPLLPLARLRACGDTVELRADDLRFRESEAAQFLNDVMGLRLDAGSVTVLEERTEGWIAGLQMAALSMRDRKDVYGFIEGFSGTNRYILDYLLEEVLASQPPEIQRFLLHTSILKRLTAPLCDAVLADDEGSKRDGEDRASRSEPLFSRQSAAILESLERSNLFLIPLDDDRRWYRYHHLFADLLQSRLSQSGPTAAAQLLSRAAEWCDQEGQVADAVGYALAAQDYHQAAGLIAKNWHLLVSNGEIDTAWSWLDALPEDVVRKNAQLGIAYCWVLWLKGQVGEIELHLSYAENALDEQVADEGTGADEMVYANLRANLTVLQSIVARFHYDFEAAIALAERALHMAPENLPPQASAQLRSVILLALASAYDGAGDLEKAVSGYAEIIRWSRLFNIATGIGMTIRMIGALRLLGRLRAADAACREALAYVQEQGMDRMPATGVLQLAMSEMLLERNELEAAEAYLLRGTELGKWSGRFDAARNAYPALARLRQARQDASGALVAIQEAETAMGEPQPPLARGELLALRARILVRQGALNEAAQCVEEAIQLTGRDLGQTGGMVALAAARVMLAQRGPAEAVVELTRSLTAAEACGRLGAAIELRLLRCLALAREGKWRQAEADLDRALALAEQEGYVRIFLDEGQPMRMLLAQWLSHAEAGPLREYANYLLSQFDGEPQMIASAQKKDFPHADLSETEVRPGAGILAGPVALVEHEAPPAKNMLIEPLSQREIEVLHLIAQGKTNQEIARQLIVAPGTIKAHAASIYRKLDVANRTEAVARARQMGILP